MSPKGSKASGSAACSKARGGVPIKKEELCVKGLVGKSLTNKVSETLAKEDTPKWISDYYKGKLKYQKNASSEEKTEFINHLLEDNIKECTHFKRLQKTIHESSSSEEGRWLSWTKVLQQDSEVVIRLSLKQGKMKKRPSMKLDHDDVSQLSASLPTVSYVLTPTIQLQHQENP